MASPDSLQCGTILQGQGVREVCCVGTLEVRGTEYYMDRGQCGSLPCRVLAVHPWAVSLTLCILGQSLYLCATYATYLLYGVLSLGYRLV